MRQVPSYSAAVISRQTTKALVAVDVQNTPNSSSSEQMSINVASYHMMWTWVYFKSHFMYTCISKYIYKPVTNDKFNVLRAFIWTVNDWILSSSIYLINFIIGLLSNSRVYNLLYVNIHFTQPLYTWIDFNANIITRVFFFISKYNINLYRTMASIHFKGSTVCNLKDVRSECWWSETATW